MTTPELFQSDMKAVISTTHSMIFSTTLLSMTTTKEALNLSTTEIVTEPPPPELPDEGIKTKIAFTQSLSLSHSYTYLPIKPG